MSFAEWTFVKDAGNATATWESIDPIEGTHSYSINDNTNSLTTFAVGLTAGVSANCGRVRVMNKQTGGSMQHWGVFANIQGALAVNVANSAYVVTYFPDGSNKVVINKLDLVNAFTDNVGLASGVYGGAEQTQGDVYALQINWQQVSGSGNIVLLASIDGPILDPSTYDWSTLTQVAAYTDSSSPYSSGVTSGFYGRNEGATVGTNRKYYDLIYIYTD